MFDKYYKKLLSLQYNFNLEMSTQIFGENIGCHLYDKWLNYDENIISFIHHLDNENKQKIFDFIENYND